MDPDFSESWVKLTEESPGADPDGREPVHAARLHALHRPSGLQDRTDRYPQVRGLLESKKIADLADIFNIPVCAHNAIGPLGAIASAHCAAAIRDFKAHELALSPSLGPNASAKLTN